MNVKLLQLQQYLNVHPILAKSIETRKKYCDLLNYLLGKMGKMDLWSIQEFKLFCKKIADVDSDIYFPKRKAVLKDTSKYFSYRYLVLTDCLFIKCFNNKVEGKKVLENIVKFYGSRYHKALEKIYEAFYSIEDNCSDINDSNLKEVYAIIRKNRLFIHRPLKKIMITGNMSAGKSTLINALAGKKVNRTQNDTCTAKLHYLYNKSGEDGFNYEWDHDLELDASSDILMTDNGENDSSEIVVGTRFRSLEDIDVHICFVDTPGVNSSMYKDHRQMANTAIETADCNVLLYLFNGENIGSDDDIKHLEFVKENYRGDIIFLVNRLDHYKKDIDSVKDTLAAIKSDLKKMGFDNPIVYPISAYAGYLGKMSLYSEKLSEDEVDEIGFLKRKLKKEDFSYEKYYPLEVYCGDKEQDELLVHSGILSLEKLIYNDLLHLKRVFIKYNPYQVTTEITIDDKPLKKNSKLNVPDLRLQEWVDNLVDILIEECSTKDFEITFHGTVLDFEDVVSAVEDAKNKGINISLKHIPAKEVKDKEQAIAEIFEEIQNGPFEDLKSPDVVKAFKMASSSDFEVSVIATMSAGKSTLINSLLGQKLIPTKYEVCTAIITEIKDNDSNHFTAKVYDKKGEIIETQSELSYEIMERLNSNKEVSKVCAEGNIPFVGADDVSLVLVDTPGPNNSRDPEHRIATYRMLSDSSKTLVLYIMNGTLLAIDDDNKLLEHVAKSMKVGGKQSRDRFIFVVNKLDEFKKDFDNVHETLEKVKNYLSDHGIENPNIYPASALTALNIRTILTQSDDDDDEVYEAKGKVRKFNKNEEMHFEDYAPLPSSIKNEIADRLKKAKEAMDDKEQALIHTGIVSIEEAIKMYVMKYTIPMKIKSIVDLLNGWLEHEQAYEGLNESKLGWIKMIREEIEQLTEI